jgi:hypothetical protein
VIWVNSILQQRIYNKNIKKQLSTKINNSGVKLGYDNTMLAYVPAD